MKQILSLVSIAVLAALFTGCASAPTPQRQIVTATVLHLAAQSGTSTALFLSPQYLPAFQAAEVALNSLAGQTNLIPGQIKGTLYALNIGGKVSAIVAANLQDVLTLLSTLESQNTNSAALQLDAAALAGGIQTGITLATAPAPAP